MNTEITPAPANLGAVNRQAKMTTLFRIVILGASIAMFARVHGAQALAEDVTKTLTGLENTWVNALVQADVAKLDAILVDTYVDTDEGAHRSDKRETLAALKSGDLKLTSITLSDMKVYAYGDAAIVTGKAAQDGTFKGESIKGEIMFTDTFIRQNGMWKAAASQRTAAPK